MTIDADGNGYVDHIKFVFSEFVKDETLTGFVSANAMTEDVSATWALEGYTGMAWFNLFDDTVDGRTAAYAAGEPVFAGNVANDAVLYMKIEEGMVPVAVSHGYGTTDFAPVLAIVADGDNAVQLGDFKPNTLDVASDEVDALINGEAVADAVGPVLMVSQTTSTKTLEAWFSEAVNAATVSKADFSFTLCNDGAGYQTNFVCSTSPATGVVQLRTVDQNGWDADMGGTLWYVGAIADLGGVNGVPSNTKADALSADTWNYFEAANDPWDAADAGRIGWTVASVEVLVGFDPSQGSADIGAPADLVITDYPNDNGGFVVATFTVSADHGSTVQSYVFQREVALDPEAPETMTWVTWASVPIGPAVDSKMSVVVPTIDNAASNWMVYASTGTATSSGALATGGALKGAELPVATLVDGAAKSAETVAFSLASNTASGQSVDDIAPSELVDYTFGDADGAGAGIELSWVAPADHGIVSSWLIGGMTQYVYGVDKYEVYRREAGTDEYELVGFAGPNSTSYLDEVCRRSDDL